VDKGCHLSHHREDGITRCAFTALTPGWEVEVTLLSRYSAVQDTMDARIDFGAWLDVNPDHAMHAPLRRHALHTAHTQPWMATAVPPQHSEHGRGGLRPGTVWAGACALHPWTSHNETLAACLEERQDEWLPSVAIGSTYPCHAEHYGTERVWLDSDVPLAVLLPAVLTTLAVVCATMVACRYACNAFSRTRAPANDYDDEDDTLEYNDARELSPCSRRRLERYDSHDSQRSYGSQGSCSEASSSSPASRKLRADSHDSHGCKHGATADDAHGTMHSAPPATGGGARPPAESKARGKGVTSIFGCGALGPLSSRRSGPSVLGSRTRGNAGD